MRLFQKGRGREAGTAIVMAVFVVFVMGSTAAVLMTVANSTKREADVKSGVTAARFLADGAVERVTVDLQALVRTGTEPPAEGTVEVDGETVEFEIERIAPTVQEFDADGLMTFVSVFRVSAVGRADGYNARSRRIVNVVSVPVYQFALFWENDLELWPGPPMTVSGRVHSNSDMYLGSENSLTLDTNYVRAVEDFFTRRKHSSQVNSNEVRIRKWVADPFDSFEPAEYVPVDTKNELDAMGIASASGYDSDFAGHDANRDGDFFDFGDVLPFSLGALEEWSEPDTYAGGSGSTLKTGEHGVSNADIAGVDTLAMFEAAQEGESGDWAWDSFAEEYVPVASGTGTHKKGPYFEEAGLAIITKADGSWVAYDGDGNDVSTALSAMVSTEQLYDARQAEGGSESVDVTVIDMDLLSNSSYFPDNGLLYAANYGAGEGTDAKGVRVTNGAKLQGPLSVVTENSLYVHGDYNTEEKKPAAVIADAVNLLSNAWTGNKSEGDHPDASDTTFNTAIVAGATESSSGVYSGGAENFPRLHEDWGGKQLSIHGAMVCPWTSKYATSPWKSGSGYYNPPGRDWHYETDFNDPEKLPPFALASATVQNVVSW